MPSIGKNLRGRAANKTNNHPKSFADKVEIRRRVLAAVTGPVFDAHAGAGAMFNAVWKGAPDYVGCDTMWYQDKRLLYVCDSRRLMRNIDLQRYTVFDFDPYGSPWEWLWILAARRIVATGESIGLCVTEGSGLGLKLGNISKALALLTGFSLHVPGAVRAQDEIANKAIHGLAKRMHCSVENIWQSSRRSGSAMLYFGVVFKGLPLPVQASAPAESEMTAA